MAKSPRFLISLFLQMLEWQMTDRSVHAGDARQSVFVTGDGNAVALCFGDTGIRLPLRRKQCRPPERHRRLVAGGPPRELDLFVPEVGKLPLIGRNDLLAELQGWLDDEVDISIHALIGRAGAGKTRLAIEFCRTIDSDPGGEGEWIAGFLSPGDLVNVTEILATHSFEWERPTLLVIDHAAECHQILARWLDRLADRKLDKRLRLLLLDREAPQGFGWWHELTASGPPSRRDLFYTLRANQLPDLFDLEERRALMAAALQAARELRSETPAASAIPAPHDDPDFDRRLAQPQFGNPLSLVMAGVIAADRGPHGALALRRLDVARQLARRELQRMTDLARSRQVGEYEMRHIVAFNGLAGGIPLAHLRKAVVDELAASDHSAGKLDALLNLLQQELPPWGAAQQARLATIQPDFIGEAVIIEAFSGEPSRQAEAAETMRRAYELDSTAAAHTLVRLVQDFAYSLEDPDSTEEEKATGQRLMTWLLKFVVKIEDPEQLIPFVVALPRQTTVLRELAADLTTRLVVYFLCEAPQSNTPAGSIKTALWLNNSAIRQTDIGRHDFALEEAGEAARLYRDLVQVRPDTFGPELARSLTTLATSLSNLGRREEALSAVNEAVCLYRDLAEVRPNHFIPDLALSLNNLANRLSNLGRREEALSAANEAVCLYRDLAEVRPNHFIPNLALSLNNLANKLSNLGQRKEALEATEEAVRLQRILADAHPDSFIPDLARMLSNRAAMLNGLGRREEALTAAEEAVRLHRDLSKARPDPFLPNFAAALLNLSVSLGPMGRREEALSAAEEAVHLYRGLVEARSDVFKPELASSLRNLADRLSDLGRHQEALTLAQEAVLVCRALVEARSDVFKPELAASLSNLAIRLSAVSGCEEALIAAEEAVNLYRGLAKARLDAFVEGLAFSLWGLGYLYGETEKPDVAITMIGEAIQLLTPTFIDVPEAVVGIMIKMLQHYFAYCAAASRNPDAKLLGPALAVFKSFGAEEERIMSGSNRSVTARDITGSSIVTGDNNIVSTEMKHIALPPADKVDVKAELAVLQDLLGELKKVPDRGKLNRAMEDAVEETAKPHPDKKEVGGALERVVKSAKAADDFGVHAEKLLPRLAALTSWLGANGHKLLALLGISP
jgi:tetratricopeptide (TPR) repeat protein